MYLVFFFASTLAQFLPTLPWSRWELVILCCCEETESEEMSSDSENKTIKILQNAKGQFMSMFRSQCLMFIGENGNVFSDLLAHTFPAKNCSGSYTIKAILKQLWRWSLMVWRVTVIWRHILPTWRLLLRLSQMSQDASLDFYWHLMVAKHYACLE